MAVPTIDVNAATFDLGQTPLHLAVERSHFDAVNVLLTSKRLAVDLMNLKGETPMVIAAQKNECHFAVAGLAHAAVRVR